jgi:hypothetical protein
MKKAEAKTQAEIIIANLETREREKREKVVKKERVKPVLVKRHPMVSVFEKIFPTGEVGSFSEEQFGGKITAGWYTGRFGCIEAILLVGESHIKIYNTLPNGSYASMEKLILALKERGYTVESYIGSTITYRCDNHRWHSI